jgi:hypothetical protein
VDTLTNVSKRKMQATIGEMYGWTKEKTSKTQNPSSEEIHNPQLEQQLHEIFGSLSEDDLIKKQMKLKKMITIKRKSKGKQK